jgi:hypothetical protein
MAVPRLGQFVNDTLSVIVDIVLEKDFLPGYLAGGVVY